MHRQKMQIDKKKATRSLPVENCIAEVQKKKNKVQDVLFDALCPNHLAESNNKKQRSKDIKSKEQDIP